MGHRSLLSAKPARPIAADQNAENQRELTDGTHVDILPTYNNATKEIIFQRDSSQICAVPVAGGPTRIIVNYTGK